MTDLQLTEIRNYLLSKKLPIDILLEVQDHFISQIQDLMREENLSFDAAFEKTKENWKDELSFQQSLFGKSETKFIKTIRSKQNFEIFKDSLKYFLPFLFLSLLLSNFGNLKMFKYFFSFSLILIIIFPIIIHFLNLKYFRLSQKYRKNPLSIFQGISSFFSIAIFYIFILLKKVFLNSEQFYFILNGSYKRILNIDQKNSTMLCISTFFIVWWFVMGVLKQFRCIKNIKQIMNFI